MERSRLKEILLPLILFTPNHGCIGRVVEIFEIVSFMYGFRTRSTWYYAKYLPLLSSSGCTTPISNAGIRMKLLKTKTTLLRWLDFSIDELVWIMTCSKSAFNISNWHIEICYTYSLTQDAKRLKHEADTETNLEIKCHKYLQVRHLIVLCLVRSMTQVLIEPLFAQAIMLFSISASRTESLGDKINAYNMYDQTLHLIKYVMKLTNSKNAKKDTDLR